jgi:Trk K+ transport system NAD-binding subunit
MKSIIVGCGRVGAGLAQSLCHRHQVVIVVDQEATAFERLGTGFTGQTIVVLVWSGRCSSRLALSALTAWLPSPGVTTPM